MLPPVSHDLQPFRFVSLADDDQRRLGTLVGQRSSQGESGQEWIEKLRAASAERCRPQPLRFKAAQLIGMVMVGLAAGAYLLHVGLGWSLPFGLMR